MIRRSLAPFILSIALLGQDMALEHARQLNLEHAANMPNFVADEIAKRYTGRVGSSKWKYRDFWNYPARGNCFVPGTDREGRRAGKRTWSSSTGGVASREPPALIGAYGCEPSLVRFNSIFAPRDSATIPEQIRLAS